MEIKAIKFRKDGFATQAFAFGGEEGVERFDPNMRYRSGLTNYLIDTGDEVILVDTGIPAGTPEEVPDEKTLIYTGRDICTYMEAFSALGYNPKQVTKILLTHKHSDHSGELKSFPNARIYVNVTSWTRRSSKASRTSFPSSSPTAPITTSQRARRLQMECTTSRPGATPRGTAWWSRRATGCST